MGPQGLVNRSCTALTGEICRRPLRGVAWRRGASDVSGYHPRDRDSNPDCTLSFARQQINLRDRLYCDLLLSISLEHDITLSYPSAVYKFRMNSASEVTSCICRPCSKRFTPETEDTALTEHHSAWRTALSRIRNHSFQCECRNLAAMSAAGAGVTASGYSPGTRWRRGAAAVTDGRQTLSFCTGRKKCSVITATRKLMQRPMRLPQKFHCVTCGLEEVIRIGVFAWGRGGLPTADSSHNNVKLGWKLQFQ
ncbi:hypothetical protein J6590_017482 [Homalodisca vitripennis]|nr:hypothetical protein J6590_017482 [Homalodisca vitripennis]